MPECLPPALPPTRSELWSRVSFTFKLGTIGALVLLLLIPLGMLQMRLNERLRTRNQAVSEITATWGSEQSVVGPFLQVPYEATVTVRKESLVDGKLVRGDVQERVRREAVFLPAEYEVRGRLDPSERYRGIYKAVVYRADLTLSGSFAQPDFAEWKIDAKDVLWDEAALVVAVSDLRGVTNTLALAWDGAEVLFQPGSPFLGFESTLRARVPAASLQARARPDVDFSMALGLNGSGGIRLAPLGLRSRVALAAPWPDPNFQGAFLPTSREITAQGFAADWQVAYYGRGYPQAWTAGEGRASVNAQGIERSTFGVGLYAPVDSYRLVERSVKYGVLFIVLIFTGFFLFETLGGLRIHAMQYTLVGAALCLFYLTLLALSELMPFGAAYLIAAAAAGGMVSLYSASVLKGARRAGVVAVELGAIFAFLYTTLQLQDYALLLGTVGLFVALGIVMYATRNLDWHRCGRGAPS